MKVEHPVLRRGLHSSATERAANGWVPKPPVAGVEQSLDGLLPPPAHPQGALAGGLGGLGGPAGPCGAAALSVTRRGLA